MPTALDLARILRATRSRSLELLSTLSDAQMMGPRLPIVNPPLWEIGHVAYFYEYWGLRCARGEEALRQDADGLYDSIAIQHDDRWDLPLPTRAETFAYIGDVHERILATLESGTCSPQELYFVRYALHHEQMHVEAFTYARQTLSYPAPSGDDTAPDACGPLDGDVDVPGGTYRLGAERDQPFVFDNEKWAHEVEVTPFSIAKAPVTQAAFAAFVEDGGYARRDLWDDAGLAWREAVDATQPVYWRRAPDGGWQRRDFDRWVPLEPHRPVLHVCWHEAKAWCRWADRRLPTEAEWELAASGFEKHTYPWGENEPTRAEANLGAGAGGCADVAAFPAGDSPFGCRQMIGNVWEWTADTFGPYPDFRPDMYREYSQMLFGTTRVLRGGGWVTHPGLIRNTWRNYYGPDRRDVWAGFRTCAQDG